VYNSGVPAWLVNVEEIYDFSLPLEENKRRVEQEIEEIKAQMQHFAHQYIEELVGSEHHKPTKK